MERKKRQGHPHSWEWVSPRLSLIPGSPPPVEPESAPTSSHPTTPFMGRQSIATAFTPCVVLADAWPGWLSVLPSYGFCCCQLLVPDPSLPWIQILLRHHIDCCVARLTSPLPQLLASFAFGQGSGSVLGALRSLVGLRWFSSSDTSPQSVPGLNLSHSDQGGVMQGSWCFVSSEVLKTPPPPAVEGRTLMRIVDSSSKVQHFTPCAAPTEV